MSELIERLRADLTLAMRAREPLTVSVLRTVLAAIANAEAHDLPDEGPTQVGDSPIAGAASGVGSTDIARRALSDEDVRAVIESERDERLAAADTFRASGAAAEASRLSDEAAHLDRYL